MAIDFPASPALNDTHSSDSRTWKFDGSKWVLEPAQGFINDLGDVAISNPLTGEVLTYDGSQWTNDTGGGGGSSVTVSDTPPVSPSEGDMWYESDTGGLFTYYDSAWVEIGNGTLYNQIVATIQAKGDLLVGEAAQSIVRLGVGSNGTRLAANSASANGLAWVSDSQNSVVDAKGDLLVGASADTIARLPVGTNGQVLVADSSQTNGVGWSSANSRNILFNGAMRIAQRGPSAVIGTTANGTYHSLDRWSVFASNSGGWSMFQSTGPQSAGFRSSLMMYSDIATPKTSAGFCFVSQKLEGFDVQLLEKGTANAEPVTVSFWVQASGFSSMLGTYVVELHDITNGRSCSRTYTISSLGTWEFKTVTFPGDVVGVLANTANEALRLNFWLYAGSDYQSGSLATSWATQVNANRAVGQVDANPSGMANWSLSGVQMNVGSVAAPFQHKSYKDELAECQRYYWRQSRGSYGVFGQGQFVGGTNNAQIIIQFPQQMRAQPTVDSSLTSSASAFILNQAGVANYACTGSIVVESTQSSAVDSVIVNVTPASSAGSAGAAAFLKSNNTTAFLALSAEL